MERLQKVIAQAGIASRRKAEELIKDGKVFVYDGGRTSWTGGLITYWAEAKLYKEDE